MAYKQPAFRPLESPRNHSWNRFSAAQLTWDDGETSGHPLARDGLIDRDNIPLTFDRCDRVTRCNCHVALSLTWRNVDARHLWWGIDTSCLLVRGPRAASRDRQVKTQVGIGLALIYFLDSVDPCFRHFCREAQADRIERQEENGALDERSFSTYM